MANALAQIDWSEKIFSYSERGNDPSFWAEPINAWTNLAFLIAAAWFAVWLVSVPERASERDPSPALHRGDSTRLWVLNALLVGIGIGSFCFHTFAERWAAMLDVGFIVLWVYWFLWLNGTRVLRWAWWLTAAALVLHLGSAIVIGIVTASPRAVYLPTLAVAYGLAIRASGFPLPGRRWLWASAVVFTVSLSMAWLDGSLGARIGIGTHFLWHICNAIALLCGSIGLAQNLRAGPPMLSSAQAESRPTVTNQL